MPREAYEELRNGETRAFFGRATAETSTLTIQTGGVYTLYDSLGAVVSGHSAQPVTGYDTAAAANPRVWKTLDGSSLTPGFYSLKFHFSAVGTADSITRVYEPEITIRVIQAVG